MSCYGLMALDVAVVGAHATFAGSTHYHSQNIYIVYIFNVVNRQVSPLQIERNIMILHRKLVQQIITPTMSVLQHLVELYTLLELSFGRMPRWCNG